MKNKVMFCKTELDENKVNNLLDDGWTINNIVPVPHGVLLVLEKEN